MVHFCLDGRGVPHEESDRGDLSEEEVDEEDDVLEDFGGDIGGSPENNSYRLITFLYKITVTDWIHLYEITVTDKIK